MEDGVKLSLGFTRRFASSLSLAQDWMLAYGALACKVFIHQRIVMAFAAADVIVVVVD